MTGVKDSLRIAVYVGLLTATAACDSPTSRSPRVQPDTAMGLYAPEQHGDFYDGRFRIRGARIYQVGGIRDVAPWDHMGDDGRNLNTVEGSVSIDVDEKSKTGTFRAELNLEQGLYVVEIHRFKEFSSCQRGGIAAYIFAHGNSGCGEPDWPKTLVFVAGSGEGSVTLNGELFRENPEIHFMVTQGIRHRTRLTVELDSESGEAGAVNPATQQIDFYVRSPKGGHKENRPPREFFDHFFAMQVIWD
jgi:hypothetical protein